MSKGSGSSRAGGSRGSAAAQAEVASVMGDSIKIASEFSHNRDRMLAGVGPMVENYLDGIRIRSFDEIMDKLHDEEVKLEDDRKAHVKSVLDNGKKILGSDGYDRAVLRYTDGINAAYANGARDISNLRARLVAYNRKNKR